MDSINGHSPQEICRLVTKSGILKSKLTWANLILRSFLGGIFISFGGLFNLLVLSGAPGLRASNPSIATLLAAFTFPAGFFLIVYTNAELVTSNMYVMTQATLQRRTSAWDLTRNWVVSYLGNMAGALAFAGFLCWWTDTLSTDVEKAFAITQAEDRVKLHSYWSINFLRGVGCNWLVGLATSCSSATSNEHVSKIYSVWIPIWTFAALGYQHCVANYFLIPIGMFYGADISVGEFIYKSCIPVTSGNLVGGVVVVGCVFWFLYGRKEKSEDEIVSEKHAGGLYQSGMHSDETLTARECSRVERDLEQP